MGIPGLSAGSGGSRGELEEAARALGSSIGVFIASLIEAMPQVLRALSAQGSEVPYSKLVDWANRTMQAVSDTIVKELPPEEVARMTEDAIRSLKGIAAVALEVSKALGDPQVLDIIRKTAEGFRKGLQAVTSPNLSDLMRAMSDPDVIYAGVVLLTLLKALGEAVRASSAASGGSAETKP
jgi:uncharacterized protein YjgD (DUF1641 family)